ncbi:hypothetical protein Gohar_006096, partial [Gossypium harknessii]|nr:hypothetical protein [Gossypium harknessii]
ALIGSSIAASGWANNLIVYLIEKFHVRSIDATQTFNIVAASTSLLPMVAAILADSFLGCFSIVWISSLISILKYLKCRPSGAKGAPNGLVLSLGKAGVLSLDFVESLSVKGGGIQKVGAPCWITHLMPYTEHEFKPYQALDSTRCSCYVNLASSTRALDKVGRQNSNLTR